MSNWKPVGVAEYMPDMPDLNSPGSSLVLNVVPRTDRSYGPVLGIQSMFGALGTRCQGAASYVSTSGGSVIVAGDAADLYRAVSSSGFANASKSSGAYTTASDRMWEFTFFNNYIIASNYTDPIQKMHIDSDTAFSDLSSGAPKARFVAPVKGFLMAAGTHDGTDGERPQRVWWSALNDPTSWPTPATAGAAQVQSGFIDLLGEGGWIMGIAGDLGSADAAIFMERQVWRAVYAGPPAVFDFFPVVGVVGCYASGSIVQVANIAYYLGENGFYAFDGANVVPIGSQKVDETFFNDLNASFRFRISAALDPVRKLIFWAYPSKDSLDGTPDKILCYAYALQRWSLIEASVEMIATTLSVGYTLDELDNFGTLETLPFSLDSRVWSGRTLNFGAFDTSHRLSYFSGTALPATVEIAEAEIAPGRRAMVRNARPLLEGVVESDRTITTSDLRDTEAGYTRILAGTSPAIMVGVRETQIDPVRWGAAVPVNTIGTCPQRAAGRFLRARLTMPAGAVYDHLTGIEIDVEPLGER